MNLSLQGCWSDFLIKKESKNTLNDLSGPESRPIFSVQGPRQHESTGFIPWLTEGILPFFFFEDFQLKLLFYPNKMSYGPAVLQVARVYCMGSRNKITENRELIFRTWQGRGGCGWVGVGNGSGILTGFLCFFPKTTSILLWLINSQRAIFQIIYITSL